MEPKPVTVESAEDTRPGPYHCCAVVVWMPTKKGQSESRLLSCTRAMKSKGLSCSPKKTKKHSRSRDKFKKSSMKSRFTIYKFSSQFLGKYMVHLYCIYIFHEYFTLPPSESLIFTHLPSCLLDGSAVQGDSNSIGASHVYQVPGETTKKKGALTKLQLPKNDCYNSWSKYWKEQQLITINMIRKILTYVLRFFNERNFSNKKEGHILGSHPTQDSSHHQDYYISRFQKFPNLNLHLPHCYLLVYPQPKNSQIHNPWLLPLCCAPFCCLGTPLDTVHPWHLDSPVQRPPWRSQDR